MTKKTQKPKARKAATKSKTATKRPAKLASTPKVLSQAIKLAKDTRKKAITASGKVTSKELIPVAIALAALSVSVFVPKALKMARAFREERKAKAAAKKVTLSKAMSAARETKNRITAAPKLPSHIPHQADKKVGTAARQKHLLKESSVRAKNIRANDYSRVDHSHNR